MAAEVLARPRVARRRRAPSAGEVLILATALLVAVVMLYPTAWMFFASFKTQETLFSGEFAAYTLRNYAGCSAPASRSTSPTASASAWPPSSPRRSCR